MLPLLLLLLQVPGPGAVEERALPAIALADFTGTDARSLDDFLGQALVIDFFAHWCAPCAKQVPHVNRIMQDHSARGLAVLGVTGDDPKTAKDWLDGLQARFPHARDPELRLEIELGFHPLPFAILVDPTGVIVWEGNPADIEPAALEALVAGALPLPAQRWPKEAQPVREALRQARWDEARTLAAKPGGAGAAYAEFVDRFVARRAELMRSAFERGDYLTADELAAQLTAGLADGELRARAVALRAELAADERAQAILPVQKELRSLWSGVAELGNRQEADAFAAKVAALAANRPGTYVELRAKSHLATLASLKAVLR